MPIWWSNLCRHGSGVERAPAGDVPSREGCACKVLSRAHLAQHGNAQAAVDREIAVMKTVYKLLPARAPLVRLLEVSEWAEVTPQLLLRAAVLEQQVS